MALAKLTRVVCKHVFDTNVDDLRDVPGAVCSFPLARRLARDAPPPPPPVLRHGGVPNARCMCRGAHTGAGSACTEGRLISRARPGAGRRLVSTDQYDPAFPGGVPGPSSAGSTSPGATLRVCGARRLR